MAGRKLLESMAAAAERRLRKRIGSWPSAAGATTREARLGLKRHIGDLRRRERKSWRLRFSGIPYPILPVPKNVAEIPPQDITIALLPEAPALAVSAGAPSHSANAGSNSHALRKHMRGLLRERLTDRVKIAYDASPNDHASGPRREDRGLVRTATAEKPRVDIRTLDAVGVALIQGLDDAGKESLESAGVKLFPNERLSLIPSELAVAAHPGTSWHLGHIRLHAARAHGLNGQDVRIGIIDTGIHAAHPEFKGRKVVFQKFARNGNLADAPVRDWHGHGTQVASLAAGNTHGVAPKAEIFMAAALTERGANGTASAHFAQILAGLAWLARNDADIFNISLTFDEHDARIGTASRQVIADIAQAIQSALTRTGILTVAAIGNDGIANPDAIMSPARWLGCIGVGAVDQMDAGADFSTRMGDKPDIYAPGVAVHGAAHSGTGRAKPADGTSFATPLVSGALALLIGRERSGANAKDSIVDSSLLRAELMSLTRRVVSPTHDVMRILDLTEIRPTSNIAK